MRRRRNRISRILALALTLSVLSGEAGAPITGVRADTLSNQISAAKQHQRELQQSIARQQELLKSLSADQTLAKTALTSTASQLDGLNANQAAVRGQVQAATDALRRVQARRDTLRADLRQLDWKLSLLEGQIQQGTEDLQAQQRALGARLADAYRSQQTSLLEQVLSSASFADVLSQASAYLNLGQQDANMAASIGQDQVALDSLRRLTVATRYRTDQLRRDAETAEADLVAQQASLAQQQARLTALETQTKRIQDQQLAAFSSINDTQAKVNAALAQEMRDQASLQNRLSGLIADAQRRAAQHDISNPPPPSNGNGPMNWPTTGGISQEFGCTGFVWEPPLGNCGHFHQGIDMYNSPGTPIHAAMGGVVAFVGWAAIGGAYMVILAHSGGLETWYGHLQARQVVSRGQYVQRGELIGYMGSTGHSTGTHLHWAVYLNGNPVNPRGYI